MVTKFEEPEDWPYCGEHDPKYLKGLLHFQEFHFDFHSKYTEDPLLSAAKDGNLETVRELLDKRPLDVNKSISGGVNSLMLAAEFGHADLVDLLIQRKADVIATDSINVDGLSSQTTALMRAAKFGDIQIVESLLQAAGSTTKEREVLCSMRDGTPNGGWSSMMYAARHGHENVTQRLMTLGEHVVNKLSFAYFDNLHMDSVVDFIVEQLVKTDSVVRHAEVLEFYFSKFIKSPGKSGTMLLQALHVPQRCPFQFQKAYLPRSAPLTYMGDFRQIKTHSRTLRREHDQGDDDFVQVLPGGSQEISTSYKASQDVHVEETEEALVEALLSRSKEHSYVASSKVKVTLFVCPVKGIVNPEMVQALCFAPDAAIQTDLAHAIVEHAWQGGFHRAHLFDLVLTVIALIALIWQSVEIRKGHGSPIVGLAAVSPILAYEVIVELIDFCFLVRQRQAMDYFSNLGNICELLLLVIHCWAMVSLSSWTDSPLDRGLLGLVCLSRWLQLMYQLRAFRRFGPQMLPILWAIRDTAAFAAMMAFCLLAITHFYFVIGTRDLPGHTLWSVYASFQPMWRLAILGDFDLYELEGMDPVFEANEAGVLEPTDPTPSGNYILVHGLFVFTTVSVTIMMLNLLVGILGSNYDHYSDQALVLFTRERGRLIVEYSSRPWLRSFWKEEWRSHYLWMAQMEEPNSDDVMSTLAAIRKLERKMEKLFSSTSSVSQKT